MLRRRLFLGLFIVAFLAGGFLPGDEPKTEGTTTRAKGQLPSNWGKLGLSDSQKQKIYKIEEDYRSKIGALQKQIDELKAQQHKEMETVLTDGQKQRLREILASKAPSESKDEKGATEKKP